jgi:hypothetical protein
MKNLLLTSYFLFIVSFLFCQTPDKEKLQIHFKNFVQNCSLWSSINDGKQSMGTKTEILPNKPILPIETHYFKLTDYGASCFVAQKQLNKNIVVVNHPWMWLEGSLQGILFRSSGLIKPEGGLIL